MYGALKKLKCVAVLVALLIAVGGLRAGTQIPGGTVLPARLNSGLSSKKVRPGQTVTARIMQSVPLPDGAKIPAGALLVGRVVSVTPAANGAAASISLRFDFLKMPHEQIALTMHLRALASFMEVEAAQDPLAGSDRGTPESVWTTTQIGGEVVYRGGGHVEGRFGRRVGEPVPGGVLGRLNASSSGECRGDDADGRPQALWLFSSNACGAYGLPHLTVEHTGQTAPPGEITLRSDKGDVNVRSGAGLLLRVNAAADPQA